MTVMHGVTMQGTEDQLVTRCRGGDLDAFGQIYAKYERQVYRYAYHLLGHRDDADDIMQETFLKAFQALAGFRSEASLQTCLMHRRVPACWHAFRAARPERWCCPRDS